MMLKKIFLFMIMVFSMHALNVIAQDIPNPGFENWEFVNGWNYTPVGWSTQNSQLIETARIDSMPNAGEYALKLFPTFDGLGEYGFAETEFGTAYIPSSLNFFAKWEKTPTAGVGVEVIFYDGSSSLGSVYWSPTIDSSAWSEINVPIEIIYAQVTSAKIIVSVSIGDFAPGEGWISVDDFSFEIINGVESIYKPQISIGPNPCNDQLIITNDETMDKSSLVLIYDSAGRIVFEEKFQKTIDTSALAEGLYVLKIETDAGNISERFQVIH